MRPAGAFAFWSPARGKLHRAAAALLALLLAAGCARTGDFGRIGYLPGVDPPLVQPAITNGRGEIIAASYPLTDEERELRALARNLLVPPGVEQAGALAFGAETLTLQSVPTRVLGDEYVQLIARGPFRSAAARYARLEDDIRNDLTRMGPFFRLAGRVADLDGKRERILGFVGGLSPGEIADARRRVRENIAVIADVHSVLGTRARIYRATLERLAIAVPSPAAAEVGPLCAALEARVREIAVVAAAPGPAH